MTTDQIPPTAVVRVSRGTFDPARYPEVRQAAATTGAYLVPAIKALPGLISYYAGASPEGSVVHVSVWDTEEHARQLDHLKEMVVDARQEAEKAGITFTPIVNHAIDWTI
ncbi:hypothetical protein ACFW1A_28245 [Kitasatospora sp. NPDC058965]|uniref:hypothetical protein n=1 Tax=Kitasatospora sp. NPDC058965 TaxID=3346682 RepID=UPI003687F86E